MLKCVENLKNAPNSFNNEWIEWINQEMDWCLEINVFSIYLKLQGNVLSMFEGKGFFHIGQRSS